jgi:hypothetical protein
MEEERKERKNIIRNLLSLLRCFSRSVEDMDENADLFYEPKKKRRFFNRKKKPNTRINPTNEAVDYS